MRRKLWVIPVALARLIGTAFSPSAERSGGYDITLKTYFDGLVKSETQQRNLDLHFGRDLLVEPMTLRINVHTSKTETRFDSVGNMTINHELLPNYLEVSGVLSSQEGSFAIEFEDGFHETVMSSGRRLIHGSATGWVGTKNGVREASFFGGLRSGNGIRISHNDNRQPWRPGSGYACFRRSVSGVRGVC